MKRDIVYFDPSISKVLPSKIIKPVWNNVIYSPLGPVKYQKADNIELESETDILTKTLKGGIWQPMA